MEELMQTINLTTDVRKINNGISVIDFEGEVNGFAENMLMDAYVRASDGETQVIILNFEKLEYLNSSGIGLLVTILIRAQRQNQRLLACGLSEHYREIFKLTRLDEAIGIYDKESEAIAASNI
jgi:anti-sigma B factor antagonist